jgi:hypothetical protein
MSSTEALVALTNGDRLALASTALAILRLPGELQQRSNAYQMLDMLAGEACGRGAYILAQAHHVLNSYSGFRQDAHKDEDVWNQYGVDRINKLVEEALAKRAELIAEEDTFSVSEEYKEKEMVAKPEARDARRKGAGGPALRLVQ